MRIVPSQQISTNISMLLNEVFPGSRFVWGKETNILQNGFGVLILQSLGRFWWRCLKHFPTSKTISFRLLYNSSGPTFNISLVPNYIRLNIHYKPIQFFHFTCILSGKRGTIKMFLTFYLRRFNSDLIKFFRF